MESTSSRGGARFNTDTNSIWCRGAAAAESAFERERILLGNLPELSVQLLRLCREHGRLTVAMAVKLTGANRNTVKNHLSRLAKAGQLARQGAGRGTWYALI